MQAFVDICGARALLLYSNTLSNSQPSETIRVRLRLCDPNNRSRGGLAMNNTEQMEKVTQGLIEACEQMSANCSKSVDAFVEENSVARTVDTGKTMLAAKNGQEAAEIHAELVKGLFDTWMAGASRRLQISARVTQEAFEPVIKNANSAAAKAVQKAGRAA